MTACTSVDFTKNDWRAVEKTYLAFLNDLPELVQDFGIDEALLPDHPIVLVLTVVGISHLQHKVPIKVE